MNLKVLKVPEIEQKVKILTIAIVCIDFIENPVIIFCVLEIMIY